MMSFFLPLLIAAVCIVLALATLSWLPMRSWLSRRRRVYELAALLPGPKTLPLLGNVNLFLGLEPSQVTLVMAELAEKYGDTFKLKMGFNFSIMMFKPRDVEVVLGSTQLLDKAMEYDFLSGWLNEGLLVSSGRKWHQRRKIITPAFHFRILESYVEIFDRQTRQMVKRLHQARGSDGTNPVELGHAAHLFTLDVLCVLGLILGSAIFVGLLIYQLKFKHLIEVTRDLGSPPALPLVGHGHHFIGKEPHEMMQTVVGFMDKYAKDMTLKVWLGPELNFLMGNPEDIKIVLGTLLFNDKAGEYKALEPWLKDGLLVSRGRKWHKRRKIITPAFHFKILDQFVNVFQRESVLLLNNLEKERRLQGQIGFNLYDWINLCTMDTICETAMGVSANAQTNVDSEYVQAVKTISMVLHKRMFNIFYRFDWTYMLTPLARAEKRALNVLHNFTEKIIVQRREELLRAGQQDAELRSADDADVGAKSKMAFLDILLQSTIDDKPLTNMDIREEVDTFMFEGHDTTSSAIMFFFYNIATYPDCQRKCIDEIISVMGKDKDSPVSYDLLNKLSYMDLCIKETLRMYPSVPLLGRKVLKECEINGKIIPAGSNIGISPLFLGRREDLFSDPDTFKPERFDVVTSAEKQNPYAYIPFSAGPRNCIGQKFAILEIKAIAANVLRHYEIEFVGNTAEPPVLIAELILRTKDPLMFKLKERVY